MHCGLDHSEQCQFANDSFACGNPGDSCSGLPTTPNPTTTETPTEYPSQYPTETPTEYLRKNPTRSPSVNPSDVPSQSPTHPVNLMYLYMRYQYIHQLI